MHLIPSIHIYTMYYRVSRRQNQRDPVLKAKRFSTQTNASSIISNWSFLRFRPCDPACNINQKINAYTLYREDYENCRLCLKRDNSHACGRHSNMWRIVDDLVREGCAGMCHLWGRVSIHCTVAGTHRRPLKEGTTYSCSLPISRFHTFRRICKTYPHTDMVPNNQDRLTSQIS